MRYVSPTDFKNIIEKESGNHSVDFVNVCTPTEYNEKHIPGVRNVPLSELQRHVAEFQDKKTVFVHCQSGNRASKAIEVLKQLGVQADLVNVEGGIIAWDEAGLPTASESTRLPIMRQVLLVAGLLVLLGVLGGWFLHPGFYLVTLFVGAGLTFAGLTGWCGMTYVLAVMPWNK